MRTYMRYGPQRSGINARIYALWARKSCGGQGVEVINKWFQHIVQSMFLYNRNSDNDGKVNHFKL